MQPDTPETCEFHKIFCSSQHPHAVALPLVVLIHSHVAEVHSILLKKASQEAQESCCEIPKSTIHMLSCL